MANPNNVIAFPCEIKLQSVRIDVDFERDFAFDQGIPPSTVRGRIMVSGAASNSGMEFQCMVDLI